MKKDQIKKLNELYLKGDLVPFIGAGLSYPFNIPTWDGLIGELKGEIDINLQPSIDFYLKRKNYWSAVELIRDFGNYDELEIQEKVMSIIDDKELDSENRDLHNYSDLGEMDFKLLLTTNYDNWLYNYTKGKKSNPINLSRLQTSSENLLNPKIKTVVHLHGTLSEHDTIVLSRNKYEELYNNERYTKLFGLLSGGKTFLFMGFSFDDQYIRRLLVDYKSYFNRIHYIILNNPTDDTIKEFKQKYRLEVIAYNSDDSTHPNELKKILWRFSKASLENRITSLYSLKHEMEELIVGDVSETLYDLLEYIQDGDISSDEAFEKADSLNRKLANKLPDLVRQSVKIGGEIHKEIIHLHERVSKLIHYLITDLMVILDPENSDIVMTEEYFTDNYLAEEKIGFTRFASLLENEIKNLEKEHSKV
ncbi:SIR2 family protein [Priestia aryabhattai]|uniref:SIR2 family protein n=1 Tax=Priestia aryabhattai TaxID=412384 RepID=UPI001CCB6CFE|nr:SIR2 family protein [Priestia aryabhattai]MBZ6485060.1 SIR2 family protein [Priestia aryabhattai]